MLYRSPNIVSVASVAEFRRLVYKWMYKQKHDSLWSV